MKIDWLRLWYRAKILWHPGCWIRIYADSEYNKDWDRFLWKSLREGKIEKQYSEYTIRVNDEDVWISNELYGNGEHYPFDESRGKRQFMDGAMCSRPTALLLRDMIRESEVFIKLRSIR